MTHPSHNGHLKHTDPPVETRGEQNEQFRQYVSGRRSERNRALADAKDGSFVRTDAGHSRAGAGRLQR